VTHPTMLIDELNYVLPPELIAQQPAERREDARLMVVRRRSATLTETRFGDIGRFLRAGDVLVVNNTRVLAARLQARKPTGGAVEILLVESRGTRSWEALVKPARRLRRGTVVTFAGGEEAEVVEELPRGRRVLHFADDGAADRIMQAHGALPLPPYVRRPEAVADERYQTVYASRPGAVAAPTAGLHFTQALMAELTRAGVEFVEVTLAVGPGTFLPLANPVIEENRLHHERFEVAGPAAAALAAAVEQGRRILPVGTTSMRVLETLGPEGLRRGAVSGSTDIFIRPGVPLRIAAGMVTNFHLPGTSLLCLVAAVAGVSLIKRAYARAVEAQFRFYSFGDAMLIMD